MRVFCKVEGQLRAWDVDVSSHAEAIETVANYGIGQGYRHGAIVALIHGDRAQVEEPAAA